MGTSTRSINKKIRRILKKEYIDKDIDYSIPRVRKEVLTKEKLEENFLVAGFFNLINTGIKGIQAIQKDSFKEEFHSEVDFERYKLKSDEITIEKIIEEILNTIKDDIHSDNLLKAFKYAMSKVIKEEKNIHDFICEFCYYLLYLILEKDLVEVLSDVYPELSMQHISKLIKEEARRTVDIYLSENIKEFEQRNITLEELINIIVEKASSTEVEGF